MSAVEICARGREKEEGKGGGKADAVGLQEGCEWGGSEKAVDRVEVPGQDLDVEGLDKVGWVGGGAIARGGRGEVDAAAGEGVGEHGED